MSKARDLANAGTALTTVSATELGYLDGVTSAVQTQINAKEATLPDQTGNSGKYLTTNGSAKSWGTVSQYALPSQTGNAGKFLGTNGTSESWSTVISGSAFTPLVEGTLTGASATITATATAGTYEVKSAYPATFTVGAASQSTATNYDPARFVVPTTGSSVTVTSSGFGNTWTAGVSSANGYGNLIFDGTRFYTPNTATTTAGVRYSTDGISWSTYSISGQNQGLGRMAYGNGAYVIMSNSGGTGSTWASNSTDGINFTQRAITGTNVNTGFDVAYGNGKFISTIGGSGTHFLVTSNNGASWSAAAYGTSVGNGQSIAYGNNTWIACSGNSTAAATSSDGVTWTARTLPVSGFRYIRFYNGLFVATVNASTNVCYTSTDAITWTSRTLPATGSWQEPFFGNGIWVLYIGNTTTAATSPNATTWTQKTLSSSQDWNTGAYGNNRYVVQTNGWSTYSDAFSIPFGMYSAPTTTY
jgi:hypothetical protein